MSKDKPLDNFQVHPFFLEDFSLLLHLQTSLNHLMSDLFLDLLLRLIPCNVFVTGTRFPCNLFCTFQWEDR
jgi:hypothetical protein